MPETPTTEGSIVAYLRLNDSDWNEKLDRAEQRARDLGRIDPTIKVHADTADAIAKLDAARLAAERVGGDHVTTITTVNESINTATGSGHAAQAATVDAVAAANKRLEAAETAAGLAADRHALSIMRLNDRLAKGNLTETQRASLELAEAAAQVRLAQAQDAVADAQNRVAAAANAAAGATDKQGKAAGNAAGRNAANAGRMGVILGVVAALVPVMSQLAGFVAGVGGAFGGMGVTAVLAMQGIKKEMAAGTDIGNQYTQAVGVLHDALGRLQETAAAGVLDGFQHGVDSISSSLPQLNQEISGFATGVGALASTVVSTLITGFRVLNPLFVEGMHYIQGLADAWQHWVNSSDGLQRFANDAQQALPLVGHDLAELMTLLTNLLGALAPFGTVVLNTLGVLLTVLNAIPAGVLVDVAAGVGAVVLALKGWAPLTNTVSGMVNMIGKLPGVTALASNEVKSLSANITSMVGWFGVAAATVGAAVAVVDAWKTAVQDAAASQDKIVNSISSGTAAAGGFADAMKAVNAWNDTGTTTTTQMTDALNSAAQGWGGADQAAASYLGTLDGGMSVNGNVLNMLNKYGDSLAIVAQTDLPKAVIAFKQFSDQYNLNADQQWRAINNMGNFKSVLTQQATQMGVTATETNLLAIANGKLADAAGKTVKQQAQATLTTQAMSAAVITESNAYGTADSAVSGYLKALDAYAKSNQTAADTGTFLGATLKAFQGDALSYDAALAGATNANFQLTNAFAVQGKETAQGVTFFRDTEKAAIDLNTGLIDVSKSGAPALISQLQAMQTAAQAAASATYQHEVSTQGAAQAAKDAATIFKTDTYDALVKDADQLGLTSDQAKKLADRYFALPKDAVTRVMSLGEQTVVQTLDGIGKQLSLLTRHPWVSTLDANGVPLSNEAYAAQLRLNDIKQIDPATIKADAKEAGVTVDQFTAKLQSIPDPTVTVTADTAAAMANLMALDNALAALQRSEAATGVGATQLAHTTGLAAFAGGGTVGGSGSPVSDSVLARLSRTEEVISNDRGQADRYRSALKLINQGASPLKVATAVVGGTNVGLQPQPVVQHIHQWTIYTDNGEQLYQTFMAKINATTGP